ncbi:hypothetical protein Tco_1458549 [Tanacetum coccineum]
MTTTTTFTALPDDILAHFPGTCCLGLFSPATCRRKDYAGEATTGIESPAIFPGDNSGPTPFLVNENIGSEWKLFLRRHVAVSQMKAAPQQPAH